MVSTSRYYPDGFIGLEQGAVLLAKLKYPSNWQQDTMLPGEAEIWAGLGYRFSAEAIHYLLWCLEYDLRKKSDADIEALPMTIRFYDFDGAVQELRGALHSGAIVGQFCDEHGRFDFVQKEGWGSDAGLDILLRGVAWLDDGPLNNVQRLIFISREAIEAMAGVEAVAENASGSGSKNKGGRPPEYDWEAIGEFVKSAVEANGKPGRGNKKLPTQEDLVILVMEHCSLSDLHPSASNVRKRVSGWLARF